MAVPPQEAVVVVSGRRSRPLSEIAPLVARLHAARVPVALVAPPGAQDGRAPESLGLLDAVVAWPSRRPPGSRATAAAALLRAAAVLGVPPTRCAVVSVDAVLAVVAARAGGFGRVVALGGGERSEQLRAAGADLVVEEASQLDLGALRTEAWVLAYDGFDSAHEGHREALTTLGNGYLATRGAAPESSADAVHYPGTYLAGLYNRLVSEVHGRTREDEHLVNVPNWLHLDLAVGPGGWWSSGALSTSGEHRELDLRRGVLTRTATLTDQDGRRVRVSQRRLVSMAQPHLMALSTTLVAEGWGGTARVRTSIDAGVTNGNVAEYASLANRHLRTSAARETAEGTVLVEVRTSQSQVQVAVACRAGVRGAPATGWRYEADDERYGHTFEVVLEAGRPVTIDKTVAVYTSRDPAIASPPQAALAALDLAPAGVDQLLPPHQEAWQRLWSRFELDLDTDRQTQLVVNLHLFHLLQSLSPHTAGLDAGVPARGLHGEGYRGHVFWDELFVLPVLTPHLPWVSRSLLDYRYRRLDAARHAAAHAGHAGAMFPWQSGSDGREETPTQLFNPRSRHWVPDNSARQRHVGLAVAHNAWRYYEATGDLAWLAHRGADLIIEVARFFVSLASYDAVGDRFHIEGVMGPDEYHDGYEDAPGSGLRDNAYTNVLTAWVCQRAADCLTLTKGHDGDELHARLHLHDDEPARWRHLARRLTVPFHDGVISQFAGYAGLRELDWARYRATYGNIERLDLILEAEGDSTNRYRLAKQADVLMLVHLLGPRVVTQTLESMGYPVPAGLLERTVDYYLARTAHGSTLSRVVHASVLARMDPRRSWPIFREALVADLDDTQGGTTREGIHLGAMAGTVDMVARAFAGYQTEGDTICLDPRLPDGVRHVALTLQHRGQHVHVALDADTVSLAPDPCAGRRGVDVQVGGRTWTIAPGGRATIPLDPSRPPSPPTTG